MDSVKNVIASDVPTTSSSACPHTNEIGAGVKEVVKKRGWKKAIMSHVRRLSLELLNIFVNHDWLFWLIGAVNKRIDLIESVFLVYPATEKSSVQKWFQSSRLRFRFSQHHFLNRIKKFL